MKQKETKGCNGLEKGVQEKNLKPSATVHILPTSETANFRPEERGKVDMYIENVQEKTHCKKKVCVVKFVVFYTS